MARLWTSGGETLDFTAEGISSAPGVVFDTANQRIAATVASYLCSAAARTTSAVYFNQTFASNRDYYLREYFMFPSLPGDDHVDVLQFCNVSITVDSTGTLNVFNNFTSTTEATTAGTIAPNTWYLLEMHARCNTASGDVLEVQLNGTSVYSNANETLGTVIPSTAGFGLGWNNSHISDCQMWVDDLAINDGTGAAQTSWCGAGVVWLLLPVSDNAVTASTWTVGDGATTQTTGLFNGVNSAPPNGIADDSTSPNQIRDGSATNPANYDANLEDYLSAGIGLGDTVTLVQPWAIIAQATSGANTGNLVNLSNPTNTDTGSNISAWYAGANAGAYPAGWKVAYGTINYAPSVTLGTRPVLRIGERSANTLVAMVSAMGLIVETVPAVITVKVVADSGSATEGRSIAVTLTVASTSAAAEFVNPVGGVQPTVRDFVTATDIFIVQNVTGGSSGVAPPAPAWPPVTSFGSPSQNDTTRYTAQWTLRVLNNSGVVTGAIARYRKAGLAKRLNNVSDWSIELDADDPQAANLTTPGNGVSFTRTIFDLVTGKMVSSAVEVSGPLRSIQRDFANNTLIVGGKDWMLYLQGRLAFRVTSYPYSASVLALSGLLRYYRLSDPTGTTATDFSAHANGTYTGGFTLAQPSLIDDANLAASFNGSTGYVSVPTTSLPTGNSPYYMGCWFVVPSTTGSNQVMMGFGTWGTTREAPHLGLNSSNGLFAGTFSGDTTATTALTVGSIHFAVAKWDGTTLTLYLDGLPVKTATPGVLNIVLAGATVGVRPDHSSNFFTGEIDEAFFGSGTVSDAQVAALYALGVSRFSAGTGYDTETGTVETVLKSYVTNNVASAAGFSERAISNLSVATDLARGTSVTGNARFDRLLASDGTGLMQQLATSGGIGFKITNAAGALTFDCFTPTDRSSNIIFSSALGTVLDFTWERNAPDPEQGGNAVIVGGGQQLAARIIETRVDTTSISTWGRTEYFVDARDTTDVPTLNQRGDAQLASSKEVDKFSAVLAPTEQMVYGLHFFLGDKVTAIIDGVPYQDQIREVDIVLDQGAAESVTPVIGTPNAIIVQDASLALHKKLLRQVNALKSLQNRT